MAAYRLGLYEKSMPDCLSWKEKLLAAKEAGYDYLEMSIDESDGRLKRLDWSDEEIGSLQEDMLRTDARIESFCLSAQRRYPLGSGLPGAEEKALEVLFKAVRLASKTGARIVQVQGYDCFYGEETSFSTKERFFRNLKTGTLMAAQYGIILGIETMENDFLNTTEKAMYYIREIDSPYLTAYPDVGNISNAASDICRDLRTGKGSISAAHLKETLPGRFRNIPYGKGQVDFPSAVRTLLDQGVGRFTAEFWYQDGSDWRAVLKENREFLAAQFRTAMTR